MAPKKSSAPVKPASKPGGKADGGRKPGSKAVDVPSTHSSFGHALANLLKTIVGSAILTLPWVTAQVGYAISLPGLAVLAYLSQYAIRLVVTCAASEKSRAYASLPGGARGWQSSGSWELISRAAFGGVGWALTASSLYVYQIGVAASYLIFISNGLVRLLGLSVLESLAALWAGLSLCCMLKTLRGVALLSILGLVIYGYVFGLLGWFGWQAPEPAPDAAPMLWNDDPAALGLWFGPAVFALQGMGTAMSIYESMGSTDPKPFLGVVHASYSAGLALYCAVAYAGYAAWGSDVAKVVIHSFPSGPLALSAQLVLCAVLALTYPLQLVPVFGWLESLLPAKRAGWWPALRLLVVTLTAVLGYLVPDMEKMVSLTGAVGGAMIGFVMPGAIFLRLQPPSSAWRCYENSMALLVVATGLVGGAWALRSTLHSD